MLKISIISLWMIFASASFAFAADLDGYTFLKISGSDARAVVKTPEGEKQLVSPGDSLGEMTITEITADRVMLKRLDKHGHSLLFVTLKNGHQQVSRLQKMPLQERFVAVDQGENSRQFGQ